MKRLLRNIAIAFVCAATIFSCSETGEDNLFPYAWDTHFGVRESGVIFNASGSYGNQYITIVAQNVSWKLENVPDWLNVSKSSGNFLSDHVDEERIECSLKETIEHGKDLKGKFDIIAVCNNTPISAKKTITVTVDFPDIERVVSPEAFYVPADANGKKFTLNITTNEQWALGTDADWIILPGIVGNGDTYGEVQHYNVEILFKNNESHSPRTADIVYHGSDGFIKTIFVEQGQNLIIPIPLRLMEQRL